MSTLFLVLEIQLLVSSRLVWFTRNQWFLQIFGGQCKDLRLSVTGAGMQLWFSDRFCLACTRAWVQSPVLGEERDFLCLHLYEPLHTVAG